ncbi:PREDICTED: transmembrane protein 14C-like [Amphimedon queenslandica]|uniref:Transmembrane protein 14C n=1 Tax=Amphimedon queenslandica TaxID=400682 RepID=A0A1X7URJ0_AMPQE|nr:PREDICTED: transmembrane protein 14C-like [Amphimedon queenslandica]|eukprot:XP_003386999.1 PREDICTED: transmembrane protein 14C-like [Amphimedon queenslandica]
MSVDYISYFVSGIVAVGGIFGFVKAGSFMSLGSGLLFGSLIAYGAYRVSANPKDFAFLAIVCCLLATTMGYRYFKTGKFMPAGLVASISLLQVLRFGARYLQQS